MSCAASNPQTDARASGAPTAVPAELANPVLYRPALGKGPTVDRSEMLRYLGYAGQSIDDALAERIEHTAAELERTLVPRGVRRVFPIDAAARNENGMPCIRLAGSTVELNGSDIFRHLKDARLCVVLACTLGMESERRLRALAGQRPLDATLLDAAASAAIEAAVRAMEREATRDAAACGMSANWRFSPGYGDCPLSAQGPIVAALNAGRLIGLTVTDDDLLLPSKSVTAVFGLFDGEPHAANDRPSCSICRLRGACPFRERNTTCYSAL